MITLKKTESHVLGRNPQEELKIGIDFIDESIGYPIGHFHYTIDKTNNSAFIDSVYLQEEYRRIGILKSNLDQIICDISCAGAKSIKLHAQTEQARTVWEKSGFKVTGENTIDDDGTPLHYYEMEKEIIRNVCRCNKRR